MISFKHLIPLFGIFSLIVAGIVITMQFKNSFAQAPLATAITTTKSGCLWEICSIDTMKMSRDRARENANNTAYDADIKRQMDLIKNSGANYVALGTPYDEEFVPYLTRWVKIARADGLHVWFRGNWSGWEGWFGYPKIVTPAQHMQKTTDFIKTHASLFQDGDIFDACPECEGAGNWPQPTQNQAYLDFIKSEHASNSAAFAAIGKKVRTDLPTMIGGHAKDVMDRATMNDLGNHVAIDHYVRDLATMQEYINYFKDTFGAKVMISEFGAPVPDLNGDMNEDQQATFVGSIFNELFKQKSTIMGLNYFDLSDGSTTLTNDDGSTRKAYQTLRTYFAPQTITGTVSNTLGDPVKNITVQATDSASETNEVKTDMNGKYTIVMPARNGTLSINDAVYTSTSSAYQTSDSRAVIIKSFIIKPVHPNAIYQIREFLLNARLNRIKPH